MRDLEDEIDDVQTESCISENPQTVQSLVGECRSYAKHRATVGLTLPVGMRPAFPEVDINLTSTLSLSIGAMAYSVMESPTPLMLSVLLKIWSLGPLSTT